MVEIFDRVLQFLEHVFLAFPVAGDVGDRPHRVSGALAGAERPHPHPQPAALRAVGTGNADLFLLALAFARRLQQAEHGLRHIGIADEDALHRTHVLLRRSSRQRQIGGVGIDHMAARIGHGQAVIGMIGDPAHHGIVGAAVGETDDAGGKGEQIEQPNHGEDGEHAEDIGLRMDAAERHQRDRDPDEPSRHQQHQNDAAAAPRRLVDGDRVG